MAPGTLVVELLSEWLSDGIVDPQVIPWFATCRAALTPPVRARLLGAAARMSSVADWATERLNQELRHALRPLGAVLEMNGQWMCDWTEHGHRMRTDDIETVVYAVGRMVVLAEITQSLELGVRLVLRHALMVEAKGIDDRYVQGQRDGIPFLLTHAACCSMSRYMDRLLRYYDPEWRPVGPA